MIRSALAFLLAVSSGVVCLAQTPSAQTPSAQTQSKTAAPLTDSQQADAYYHFAMGRLYAEMGQAEGNRAEITKAIQNYEEALKLDPNSATIFEELTDLYIATNRLQDAITQAEDQLKANPDNLTARKMLAHVYMRALNNGQNGINEDALRKAMEQYQKIVQKDPKDVESWVMLGRLNGYMHNSPEAEKCFNTALQIDPESEEALVGLADLYGQLGDSKKAAEKLKQAVDKHPTPRTLAALAQAYEDLEDYKDAAAALQQAMEAGADDEHLPQQLARDLQLSGQTDAALKLYEEMAAQNPRDPETQLHLCDIYTEKHDLVKARGAFNRLKAIAGNNPRVRFEEVPLLEAEGKNDEAVSTLKKLLDDTAKKSYSEDETRLRGAFLRQLAELYSRTDQTSQVVDALKQLASIDPSAAPQVEVDIIETYINVKDFTNARSEADAALKIYPKDPKVAEEHARVLVDQGKVDDGIAELRALSKGKPNTAGLIQIAQQYETAKRYSDSAKTLDEAEKVAGSDAEKLNVTFQRGALLDREKKFDQSEAEFRKVLAADPNNSQALNYLGYSLADRNVRLDEAYQMVKKALDLAPDQSAYMDSLGWVYYRQGKLVQAEEMLIHAVELTKDATIHDHLGDVYLKEGKTRDAVAQWQASLKEYNSHFQVDVDADQMSKVTQKLQNAQAQLAKQK